MDHTIQAPVVSEQQEADPSEDRQAAATRQQRLVKTADGIAAGDKDKDNDIDYDNNANDNNENNDENQHLSNHDSMDNDDGSSKCCNEMGSEVLAMDPSCVRINDSNKGKDMNDTISNTSNARIDGVADAICWPDFVRPPSIHKEIVKRVVRQKLNKLRHLVIPAVIDPAYLDQLFPRMLQHFQPQKVHYNGGIAGITEWKISCYLEVMEGGIPTTHPSVPLLVLFKPLLQACNDLFLFWYRQQHACNGLSRFTNQQRGVHHPTSCRRLMTFITRYTPNPGEQALLKHVDGAGKVDGSVVVALPIDRWSAPLAEHQFEGGGLTFWDGGDNNKGNMPIEIHYDTRAGDIAFIDRAVWHQADPITKGTRWALVIFYKVE